MSERYAPPGSQICRKSCQFCAYVDLDKNPNYDFLRKVGLDYTKAKEIIKEDGGVIGYCRFAPTEFVVLGIPCQKPQEFITVISELN